MSSQPPAASPSPSGSAATDSKRQAGLLAAAQVEPGMRVGLGTGSTAVHFMHELVRRKREDGLDVTFVSSSHSVNLMAAEAGIPLLPLDQVDRVDLYADGADEVDPRGRLIKGRGAAMLREKILVHLADRFLVLIDESKRVARLGEKFPVPIEVTSMAWQLVRDAVRTWGGEATVRLAGGSKDGPVISDQGNFVLDARFPPGTDLAALGPRLDGLPGLVEHGLFLDYAAKTRIILGGAGGAQLLDPERP